MKSLARRPPEAIGQLTAINEKGRLGLPFSFARSASERLAVSHLTHEGGQTPSTDARFGASQAQHVFELTEGDGLHAEP
jgi:hypothetical protein